MLFRSWDDMHKWSLINKALEMGIPEPMETYSSSPHLFTDLDIPEGTKGRLRASTLVREPRTDSPSGGRSSGGAGRSGGGRGSDGRSSEGRGGRSGAQQSSQGAPASTPAAAGEPRAEGSRPPRRRNRTRKPSTPPAA